MDKQDSVRCREGVHFFCMPKRNEPKKKAPNRKKINDFGCALNSLRSNNAHTNPKYFIILSAIKGN